MRNYLLMISAVVATCGISNIAHSYEDTNQLLLDKLNALEESVAEQQAIIEQQQQTLDSLALDPDGASDVSNFPKTTIGGQYRLMYNTANFGFHEPQISDEQNSSTFFNQRFRTWLTIETSENIRGYLQAEMGHILWGDDDLDFPKTYTVAPPRDQAGIELHYGYLEYESLDIGLLRAGIQGWNDPYGQVLASADWDFSVGGLLWQYGDTESVKFQSAIFQLVENDVRFADDAYLLISDIEMRADECRRFGLSAFYLNDKGGYSYPTLAAYDTSWDLWLGARVTQDLGFGALNGFMIYNGGARRDDPTSKTKHDGVALKAELADLKIGPGKFRTQALYSTGNSDPNGEHSNEFRTIAQSARDNFGAQGYWSYLIISSPHGPSDVDDLGVSLQNRGLGLLTLQSQYELGLAEKLSSITSAGWLQSSAVNPVAGSRDMGTEIVQAFRYQFGPGLSTDFGGAVLFTGDFYSLSELGPAPDDVYELFSRVQLDFQQHTDAPMYLASISLR